MKIYTNSIAHTTWNCKYLTVFTQKYRRQVIYGKIKGDIGQILRKLCEWKGVEIIEAEFCPIIFIYVNREFWCRGYYVDTVGQNKNAIVEYTRNQLQKDLAYEQMSINELIDPFMGGKNTKA